MTPTLQLFTRALLTPDLSFKTLADARAATGADGLPRLMRTTRFAEAEITWRGRQWLLSMPLSPAALAAVERTASQLGRLNTDHLAEYRILRDELRWTDPAGRERRFDLALQLFPRANRSPKRSTRNPRERLLAALDTLETALRKLNFSHNNLRAGNLRWSGRAVRAAALPRRAFRPFGRRRGLRKPARTGPPDGRSDVRRRHGGRLHPAPPPDGPPLDEPRLRRAGLRRGRRGIRVRDTENNPVIRPQYTWAGDFREGRAEVETPSGMGLIDRQGRYVIPPEYEIVDYAPVESVVRVRKDGRWAELTTWDDA